MLDTCRSSRRTMKSPMLKTLIALLFSLTLSFQAYGKLNITQEEDKEWCIADEQFPDEDLQRAMDWACNEGGADCSHLLVNHPCYLPNTMKDHASYAFNDYYQKFKHKGGSCFFKAAAFVTDLDPSHGSCKFEFIP